MNSLTERARSTLQELADLFADSSRLIGSLAQTYIQHQAGADRPLDLWSWGNRLLVWCHSTNDARTLKQWQQVGRIVSKGAQAFYLLAPNILRIKRNGDNEDDEKDPVLKLTGFRCFPVFGVEDTIGKSLPPPPDYSPDRMPSYIDIARQWDLKVRWTWGKDGTPWGSYNPDTKTITLATHEEATFFHELGHAADHRAQGSLEPGQRADQEAVAELCAAVLARLAGRKIDKAAWTYIQGYAYNPGKMLKLVLPRVESALNQLFGEPPIAQPVKQAESVAVGVKPDFIEGPADLLYREVLKSKVYIVPGSDSYTEFVEGVPPSKRRLLVTKNPQAKTLDEYAAQYHCTTSDIIRMLREATLMKDREDEAERRLEEYEYVAILEEVCV